MWADYMYSKEARLKDYFLLLKIDQLVDSTNGHVYITFIDAYLDFSSMFCVGVRLRPHNIHHTTRFLLL